MKKHNLLLAAGAVAVALGTGSAVAAPVHGGNHHGTPSHTVTHVYNAPRPGHNNGHHHASSHHYHHHHNHHGASAGDLIIATAILISAIM